MAVAESGKPCYHDTTLRCTKAARVRQVFHSLLQREGVRPVRWAEAVNLVCNLIRTLYPILKDLLMKKAACDLDHHKRKQRKVKN